MILGISRDLSYSSYFYFNPLVGNLEYNIKSLSFTGTAYVISCTSGLYINII